MLILYLQNLKLIGLLIKVDLKETSGFMYVKVCLLIESRNYLSIVE